MVRSSARQRVIACLGLAVYGCVPMQASLHRALEQHKICVEHGHVAHSSGDASAAVAPSLTTRLSAASAGDDEHCEQTHIRPDYVVVASWPMVLAPRVQTRSTAVVDTGRQQRLRSIPLLSEAPKQSPPV